MRAVAQIAQSVEQGIENPHDSIHTTAAGQHTLQGFAFNAGPFCYAPLVNLWQGCSPSTGLIIPAP